MREGALSSRPRNLASASFSNKDSPASWTLRLGTERHRLGFNIGAGKLTPEEDITYGQWSFVKNNAGE